MFQQAAQTKFSSLINFGTKRSRLTRIAYRFVVVATAINLYGCIEYNKKQIRPECELPDELEKFYGRDYIFLGITSGNYVFKDDLSTIVHSWYASSDPPPSLKNYKLVEESMPIVDSLDLPNKTDEQYSLTEGLDIVCFEE